MKAKDWKKWAKCAGIRAIKDCRADRHSNNWNRNCTWADRHEISNFHTMLAGILSHANQHYRFAGM